jgi:hypothetical protein
MIFCAGSFHLNKDATEQQIRSPSSKSARGAAPLRVRIGVASTIETAALIRS